MNDSKGRRVTSQLSGATAVRFLLTPLSVLLTAMATTTTALPNMWLNPTASDPVAAVRSEATYSVTFQGAWTTTVTSDGVLSGAHFTTLIGGVHNAGVTFLREGGMASAGVELMAELGGTSTLASDVRTAEPSALSVLQGSGGSIGPTGSSTINPVTLTTDHPRVTLLSMVAPSPDWFVGISGLSLLDVQGDWLSSRSLNLYPWDAGTEEGTEFSLSNAATSPQGFIASLRGLGKFSNEPIATLTFTLQSVNTAPSFSSDTSFEVDENQTATAPVVATDPDSGDGVAYAISGGADQPAGSIAGSTPMATGTCRPWRSAPAPARCGRWSTIRQLTTRSTCWSPGRNYGWDPVPGYNEGVAMTDLVKFPDALEAKWSSGSPTLATSGGIFLEGASDAIVHLGRGPTGHANKWQNAGAWTMRGCRQIPEWWKMRLCSSQD